MCLDLEPGLVKIADSAEPGRRDPVVQKTEGRFSLLTLRAYAGILAGLTGPLEVTYTVNPQE